MIFRIVVLGDSTIAASPLSRSSIAHDHEVAHVFGIGGTVCCVPRANSLRPQSSVKVRPLMKQSASLGNSLLQETLSIK